uniref:50S ribosomal protein L35 n=1 Tax=Schizymenia dubyi TaxID=38368 RepID=A0A1C9C946_9FLOR|nr:ribosomal protein L35 [Schizymenia dubyi]AOM64903.1 ribosomal protein L35 [Schizymenia dubyi]
MHKLKTSKSILKRFKMTHAGKLLRRRSMHSHLLEKKTTKRKQKLKSIVIVRKQDFHNFRYRLPYIY